MGPPWKVCIGEENFLLFPLFKHDSIAWFGGEAAWNPQSPPLLGPGAQAFKKATYNRLSDFEYCERSSLTVYWPAGIHIFLSCFSLFHKLMSDSKWPLWVRNIISSSMLKSYEKAPSLQVAWQRHFVGYYAISQRSKSEVSGLWSAGVPSHPAVVLPMEPHSCNSLLHSRSWSIINKREPPESLKHNTSNLGPAHQCT